MKVKHAAGFTMIELMITIAILATLTMLTAQSIQQGVQSKVKIQSQIDDSSRLRDALKLIERDINLAYHYTDFEYQLLRRIYPNEQQFQTYIGKRDIPRKNPETHFVGTAEALDFVTSNNANMVRNAKQADFAEVGYSLKDCKSLGSNSTISKCIWRRSSNIVDEKVTEGGADQVLIENITEFKLRYIGKGKQDWSDTWRTDEQGDGNTKSNFPQAVEVSVTLEKKTGKRSKKYSMQLVVPIHFPNNLEKTNEQATAPQ